jgi:hypothetical protein
MNNLPRDKQIEIIAALSEGMSIRAVGGLVHLELIHSPSPATKTHMMISPANTKPRMIADCLRL